MAWEGKVQFNMFLIYGVVPEQLNLRTLGFVFVIYRWIIYFYFLFHALIHSPTTHSLTLFCNILHWIPREGYNNFLRLHYPLELGYHSLPMNRILLLWWAPVNCFGTYSHMAHMKWGALQFRCWWSIVDVYKFNSKGAGAWASVAFLAITVHRMVMMDGYTFSRCNPAPAVMASRGCNVEIRKLYYHRPLTMATVAGKTTAY